MSRSVFTLPDAPAGRVVINNRYEFVDGKHERTVEEGRLLEPVLVAYYGCTVEYIEDAPAAVQGEGPAAPTLAKAETAKAK